MIIVAVTGMRSSENICSSSSGGAQVKGKTRQHETQFTIKIAG
jgi:hypothetical protein